jgi:hypothetical protein
VVIKFKVFITHTKKLRTVTKKKKKKKINSLVPQFQDPRSQFVGQFYQKRLYILSDSSWYCKHNSVTMDRNEIQHEHENITKLFGFYLKWFRLSGAPLMPFKKSRLYYLYSTFILLNAYSVLVTMSVDMFLHFDDLERIMENSRVIVPASSSLWVHLCLR